MSFIRNFTKTFSGFPSKEAATQATIEQNLYDEGFTGGNNSELGTPTSKIDDGRWLQQLNDNPRLSGLNKVIADNGVTPYGIYYEDPEKGKVKVKNHPLELELNKATVPMFFSLWTAYRYMTGTVFIAYETVDNQPANFQVFTTTHLVKDGRESGSTFVFKKGNKEVTFPNNRVIIDYDINPVDPYTSGFGKAGAIMHEVEADTYILRYLTQFYVNSARPDAFIIPIAKPEQELPDNATLERLATRLRDFHKGWANAHKMAILSFEAKIESIPTNHRDMELLETRRMYRDTSHQHFGIPPEIVGIVENSNKATVVAAEHIYAKQVRMPLLHHIEDIINSKILPEYSHSEDMYFAFENILPDDDELNLQKAERAEKGATVTINEHREFLGLPRIKGEYGNMIIGTDYDPKEHGVIEVVQHEPYDEVLYAKIQSRLIAKASDIDEDSIVTIQMEEENE